MIAALQWTATMIVFLNFDGARLSPANGFDDATHDRSVLIDVARDLPAFDFSPYAPKYKRDQAVSIVARRVRDLFKGFDVAVVTRRPAEGTYSMVMLGGSPEDLYGELRAEDGVAPVDFDNRSATNIAIVWAERVAPKISDLSPVDALDELAVIAAHELGHTFGLSHASRTDDIMHPGRLTRRLAFYGESELLAKNVGRDDKADGSFGSACSEGTQCDSRMCLSSAAGSFCSQACSVTDETSCPADGTCVAFNEGAYCVPQSVPVAGCATVPGAMPRSAGILVALAFAFGYAFRRYTRPRRDTRRSTFRP